jgi:hypothetical protein
MNPIPQSRRQFLTSSASGVGGIALANLLMEDGVLASGRMGPLDPKRSHFPAKAKSCIFVYAAGGPSQLDLFDPKPMLNQRNGELLPDSLTEGVRFAFIKNGVALLA